MCNQSCLLSSSLLFLDRVFLPRGWWFPELAHVFLLLYGLWVYKGALLLSARYRNKGKLVLSGRLCHEAVTAFLAHQREASKKKFQEMNGRGRPTDHMRHGRFGAIRGVGGHWSHPGGTVNYSRDNPAIRVHSRGVCC